MTKLDSGAFAGFVGPYVGKFIAFVAVVAAHPYECGFGRAVKRADLLHDVEILYVAAFLFPAVGFPAE